MRVAAVIALMIIAMLAASSSQATIVRAEAALPAHATAR